MKSPQKSTLVISLILLIVFNALDTIFSVKYIKFGPLCESNPIMDTLLHSAPQLFILYKIFVVSLLSILLYWQRKTKIVPYVLLFITFVYTLLMIWWTYVIFLLH